MIPRIALLWNVLATALVSAASASAADAPLDLKVKWPVGQKLAYRMAVQQDLSTTLPGSTTPMNQAMQQVFDFSIASSQEQPDHGKTLEFQYERIRMNMNMAVAGMAMTYDSAAPSNDVRNPLAATMGRLVGQKVRVNVDANGRFAGVKGLGDAAKAMGSDSTGKAPIAPDSLDTLFDSSMFGDAFTGNWLPGKPVKPGDSWNHSQKIPLGSMGTFQTDTTYTLAGSEPHQGRSCAVIQVSAKMKGEPVTESASMSMALESGTMQGKVWFDPELGATVDSELEQDLVMKMSGQPTAPGAGTQPPSSVSTTMKQKIRFTLEKVNQGQ